MGDLNSRGQTSVVSNSIRVYTECMKLLPKVIVALFFLVLSVFFYYKIVLEKIPINNSKHFFKNKINQIFVDNTTGCLDICFSRSYEKIPADIETFTVYLQKEEDSGYAKDKQAIFYKDGEKIDADPSSFRVIGMDLAKDKYGYIIYKNRLVDYISTDIDKNFIFNPSKLEVVYYDPFDYLVIKYENKHYLIRLNPQPKSVSLIQTEDLQRYLR